MNPANEVGHQEVQGLLPWWANGTLSPEESRRVEAHLERCPACQREALLLTELEEALESLPPAGRDEAWETAATMALPKRTVLPWLGWAAAAVLALALGLETGVGRDVDGPPSPRASQQEPTRVLPTYRLDAVRRSSADTVVIPEGEGAGEIQLLLHVDLGPGALPLDLTLEDADGRTVLREADIRSLYDHRFLFLRCTSEEVPPGRYQVVLRGRGPQAPAEALRYSFRVVEGAEPETERSP